MEPKPDAAEAMRRQIEEKERQLELARKRGQDTTNLERLIAMLKERLKNFGIP